MAADSQITLPCEKCELPYLCQMKDGTFSCHEEIMRQARAREAMYREAGYP